MILYYNKVTVLSIFFLSVLEVQKVYSIEFLFYNIFMRIGKVTLTDFCNYTSQTVTLREGLNVFEGENASGKTNFAESLYCCAIGKSPRFSE